MAPDPLSGVLGHSDPLYLHPSDNPGLVLVSKLFDGDGFSAWKRAMILALSSKNKLGFIDGSCVRPPATSPQLRAWDRANDMVISWILSSLHRGIAASVIYYSTAKEIWSELEERLAQTNGARLFQIQRELNSVSQASDSIASYFTRI